MSKTAWVTLSASAAFTCGVIYYVHISQKNDRERLREGVLNDLARQQKKLQNVLHLEQQGDITKLLRQQQQLHDEEDRKTRLNSDT